MARQTRQQRRERRAESAPAGRRAPARPPALAGDGAGDRGRPPAPPTAERTGGGPFRFFGEAVAELKKVEWPRQQQVIQGTIVVLVACLVVGAYLWANDKVWQNVVHRFLIK